MKVFTQTSNEVRRTSFVTGKFTWLTCCFSLLMLLNTLMVKAQFSIAASATNYTENFNALTSGTWTNNSSVTGWYARTDATASITTYGAGTGSTTTAGLYAFGVAGTNPPPLEAGCCTPCLTTLLSVTLPGVPYC